MGKKTKFVAETPRAVTDDPERIADMERFYFLFALAVTLVAGELVWWQARTANDYLIEYDAAAIYSTVSNRDQRDLLRMEVELEAVQAELDAFTQERDVIPQ